MPKDDPPRTLYAAERHQAIVREAQEHGRVDVASISEQLGVTPETVRRDLTALERRGL
ncbi:MAG TPA: DeoR/GlpR transcriptional regulator, partial [Propionibacterium sp.]|nr:DeoR/GlpR transcriptional regulator [Propionibacterium sp.]